MPDMGLGQPVLGECVHARPCHPVALTASAQRLTPITHDGLAEYPEQPAMARHGIVSIVPQQHALQPGALLRERPVQAPPPRVCDGLPFLAAPLRTRLAPDRKLPVPRCTAYGRQTEHVEGRRLVLRPPLTPFSRKAPQCAQPRLLRMPLPVDLAHTFPPCSPEPFGGVAHDADLPPCVLTPPAVGPPVQDVVLGDRRRQGAHTAPWRGPCRLRGPLTCFPPARVQPLLPLAHDALVPKPRRDARHQPGGVNRIEGACMLLPPSRTREVRQCRPGEDHGLGVPGQGLQAVYTRCFNHEASIYYSIKHYIIHL
jgi:hypothetical protein